MYFFWVSCTYDIVKWLWTSSQQYTIRKSKVKTKIGNKLNDLKKHKWLFFISSFCTWRNVRPLPKTFTSIQLIVHPFSIDAYYTDYPKSSERFGKFKICQAVFLIIKSRRSIPNMSILVTFKTFWLVLIFFSMILISINWKSIEMFIFLKEWEIRCSGTFQELLIRKFQKIKWNNNLEKYRLYVCGRRD